MLAGSTPSISSQMQLGLGTLHLPKSGLQQEPPLLSKLRRVLLPMSPRPPGSPHPWGCVSRCCQTRSSPFAGLVSPLAQLFVVPRRGTRLFATRKIQKLPRAGLASSPGRRIPSSTPLQPNSTPPSSFAQIFEGSKLHRKGKFPQNQAGERRGWRGARRPNPSGFEPFSTPPHTSVRISFSQGKREALRKAEFRFAPSEAEGDKRLPPNLIKEPLPRSTQPASISGSIQSP